MENTTTDNSAASLVPLLRYLKAAAHDVGFMDVVDWACSELDGYRTEPPPYRRVIGTPFGFNPLNGWIPVFMEDRIRLRQFGVHHLRQPISAIEAAVCAGESGKAQVHFSANDIEEINAAAGTHYSQIATTIDSRALKSLLRSVESLARRWEHQAASPVGLPRGVIPFKGEHHSITYRPSQH
ncbi:MAG: hypothetical protein AAGJ94_09480 [Pseudomonadota bacterium]